MWIIPGAHKAATTTVQQVFAKNLGRLQNSKVCIIDRDEFYGSVFRKYLSEGIYYQGNSVSVDMAKEGLLSICKGYGNVDTYIFFVENMFGEPLYGMWSKVRPTPCLYPGFEIGLKKFIAAASGLFSLKGLYFIRRQDEFIDSLYAEYIHNGFNVSPRDYLMALLGCDLAWGRIVSIFERQLGEPVKVVPFEEIKSGKKQFVSKIMKCLGLDATLFGWDLNVFENPSLDMKGMRVAISAFPALDEPLRRELVKLLRFNLNMHKGERYSIFLDDTERFEIARRHSTENIHLINISGGWEPSVMEFYRAGGGK